LAAAGAAGHCERLSLRGRNRHRLV